MLSFVKEAIIMEKERQELLDLHCTATIDGYTDFILSIASAIHNIRERSIKQSAA